MTSNTPLSEPSATGAGPLRGADHDRGLQDVDAVVVAITQPTAHIVRIVVRLSAAADEPAWADPNVAFRLQLGPAFGDASRIYTVRSFDAASAAMTFDVVRHGEASPMMQWVAALAIGDGIRFIGPRPHFRIPATPGRPVAIFADDTAIPALYALMQQWPSGVTGDGWIATDDGVAFEELPAVEGLRLRRIANRPGALIEQTLTLSTPGDYVVWGAGERDDMRAIRQYFRETVALPKDDVAIAGYWKRGVSNSVIDDGRRKRYERLLADGGTLADFDDLGGDV